MQATLLSVGIAVILALIAALAGPYFVDWNQYRSVFEAEASRVVGMPVRVTGAIDAQILPTPSVVLRGIEAGAAGAPPRLRARELAIEFQLGALLRGEWRAAEMRLHEPEIEIGIGADGRIDWPVSSSLEADRLTIDRLAADGGRIVLTDAIAGARLVLDNVGFKGEARSLVGPVKGEGRFEVGGEGYGYRVAAGRAPDDPAMKLRLAIERAHGPLTVEADGLLRLEGGAPQFDGTFAVARPVRDDPSAAAAPWRLSAHIKAGPARALVEQVDFQFGPDEHPIRLNGVADFKFGQSPRFNAVLSARQIDLDAALALPDPARRPPLAALRALAERFAGAVKLPIPGRLGIGIDVVTLAGSSLQAVRGDLKADATGWDVETFEFRAPGFAQARLSGRLGFTTDGPTFAGPVAIEANDPKSLLAWLEGRSDPTPRQFGLMRVSADLTVDAGHVGLDRLKTQLDRQSLEGRLSYAFAAGRPTRLEADLKAAEFDLDAALAVARAAVGGSTAELPGELVLGVEVAQATIAGIEAKDINVKLRYSDASLTLERLSVGDLGGTALDLRGRIENWSAAPRGAVTLDLSASSLDGVLALVSRLAPRAAEAIRPSLPRLVPVTAHATLSLDPSAAAGATEGGTARLAVDGAAGALRLRMTTEATGRLLDLSALALAIDGQVTAEDGTILTGLLALDRFAKIGAGAATLTLRAHGPAAGEVRIDTRLDAGGLVTTASGTVRPFGDAVAAALDLSVDAADVAPLARGASSVSAQAIPVALKTHLTVTGSAMTFEDLSGTVTGSSVHGRIGVTLGATAAIDGRLEVDSLDAAGVMAVAIGMPAQISAPGVTTRWSAEPFAPGPLDRLSGRIAFEARRAELGPAMVAQPVRGHLRFGDGEIAFEDIDADLASGHVVGQLAFRRIAEGLTARLRVDLTDADAAALVPGGAHPPLSGRIALRIECEGTGLSPATFIGSLKGSGMVTLDRAEIASLDPGMFEAVIRAADGGTAVDATKIEEIVRTALDGGNLRIPHAEAAVAIASGQARLTSMSRGDDADLHVAANVDLGEMLIDARVMLSRHSDREAASGAPARVVVILKGPLASPKRTIDTSALASWLLLRSVDRETKRIEAIEGAQGQPPTGQPPVPPPAPATPEVRGAPTAVHGPPADGRSTPRVQRKPARPDSSAAPSGDRAPPLPPPIEIRPVPGSSRG